MRQRKLVRMLASVSAVALLATACGGGEEPSEEPGDATEAPADGDTEGEEGEATEDEGQAAGGSFSTYICEPQAIVPANSNETCGSNVVNAVFSFLVSYNTETVEAEWGDESPNAIAESIESDDNTTWTITLKDGWSFHDGSPVTAQSFVDAWNFAAYGPNAQGNNYFFDVFEGYEALNPTAEAEGEDPPEPETDELSGLEVVDETTFEVTLTGPYANFPSRLGYNPFAPMPEAAFEDMDTYAEEPIGNGPYMMDGPWQHDQAINLVRFEDYAGEPGNADAVEFRIYGEINTAYTDLQAGNLDVIESIPPEQIASAPDELGDRFIERESSSFTYLGMPVYAEGLDDAQVRQAFSQAIDREAIAQSIFNGTQTPADAMVSPVVDGYREGACGELCEYDPEAAAQKLEDAGGWEGPLTLWYNSGAGHDQWVQAVGNQLTQNLGIEDIQYESLQFAEYLDVMDSLEFTGPFRLGWVMDYPSAENYLAPIHSCNGSSNGTSYCNEEVDDLITQGNQAETSEAAVEYYNQAEDLIIQDMPIIPMFFGLEQGGHSENVTNVSFDPFGFIQIADVEVAQ